MVNKKISTLLGIISAIFIMTALILYFGFGGNKIITGYFTNSPGNSSNIITNSNLLSVSPSGETSSSSSVGGAINLDNTKNIGAGEVIYTNFGIGAKGRLMSIRCDNELFNQECAYITNDGSNNALAILTQNGPGLTVISTSQGSNKNVATFILNSNSEGTSAINAVSKNAQFSTVQISGIETNHGTLKISHEGDGHDINAAAISIDLKGKGTAAQGIFIDSTEGGTSGNLIQVLNNHSQKFVLYKNGNLDVSGNLNIGGNLKVEGCIKYKGLNGTQILGVCV